MIFWQTTLFDQRHERTNVRWPPSWVPDLQFLHKSGAVRQRNLRGRDYLTNDVVFVDLSNSVSVGETDSVIRPARIAKRLYPLDHLNRAFALSIVFQLPQRPTCIIDKLPPRCLPYFSYDQQLGTVNSAENLANRISELPFRIRGMAEQFPLRDLGSHLSQHLASATGYRQAGGSSEVQALGHALYMSTDLLLSPKLSENVEHISVPRAIIDRPPSVRGRPFVAVCRSAGSAAQDRRFRTFLLRTCAEIDIANFIYGSFSRDVEPAWARVRGSISKEYLERQAPNGHSGADARRLWQLSVERRNMKFSAMRSTARDRLASALASATPVQGPVMITAMGDINVGGITGPVGAIGDHAQGIVGVSSLSYNLNDLARELDALASYLRESGGEASDVALVEAAVAEARVGNRSGTEGLLRRASRRIGTLAKELGMPLAHAAIIHYSGLG